MTTFPAPAPDQEREQALERQGRELIGAAEAIRITDDATYVGATDFLLQLKSSQRSIVEFFAGMKSASYAAWRVICGKETNLLAGPEEAERITKRKLSDWRADQQRRAAEEEARLQAEARKRDDDRRQAEALAAEAAGDHQAAEEIINEPAVELPVYVSPPVPKLRGISYRETWPFEVVDFGALVRHCAAHPEDTNLLQVNTAALRSMVTSRKSLTKIPGVKVWKQQDVAAGRR